MGPKRFFWDLHSSGTLNANIFESQGCTMVYSIFTRCNYTLVLLVIILTVFVTYSIREIDQNHEFLSLRYYCGW